MMKNIAGLVFTLLLSTAYALFVDAESGVVFIAVFAAAPIISVLITIIIKKKLEFETSLSSTLLNKNDHVSFTATFRKHSIIPAPFIEVKLVPSLHFDTPEYSSYKISLTSKSDEKITAQYIARIWGTATIEISEITITDYLGIVSFPVITAPHVSEISIFPTFPTQQPKTNCCESSAISSLMTTTKKPIVHRFHLVECLGMSIVNILSETALKKSTGNYLHEKTIFLFGLTSG